MKMKNKYKIISNFFNNIFYLKFVSINDKLILIKKYITKLKSLLIFFWNCHSKLHSKKFKKVLKLWFHCFKKIFHR